MRKIDDRINLAATTAHAMDLSDFGHAADAQAATALEVLAAQDKAGGNAETQAKDHGGGDGGDAVHTTLVIPGIGLGYASLDGIEDQDVAFLMTAQGLTVVASATQGYLVKSDVPMDATLAKIMAYDHASPFTDLAHGIGALTATTNIKGFDREDGHGFDLTGTAQGDSVLGSEHSDIIHGLAFGDTVDGGAGDDIVWGGSGNDTIEGGAGNDELLGGVGADTLDGGMGDDFIFGGSGNDHITGADGNDLLLGGSVNDILDGGAGDDVLVGGSGADTLTGGDGADVFFFVEGDSGAGAANQDQVTDFQVGVDQLDLTSFSEPLDKVNKFHHHAYEMVVKDTDHGSLIQIDLNGDGVADQEILVTTTDGSHLSHTDYVI